MLFNKLLVLVNLLYNRMLVVKILCLTLLTWAATAVPILYRKEMNARNWKRGIIDECNDSSTFSNEFIDEGEAYTQEGFVALDQDDKPIETTGVFVSIGIDLGSKDESFLTKLFSPKQEIDELLIQKIIPFLKLKGEIARKKLEEMPLKLSEEEELRVATTLKLVIYKCLESVYDKLKTPSAVQFSKLSFTMKTILMSFFSHHSQLNTKNFKGDRQVIQLRDSIIKAVLTNDFSKFGDDLRQLAPLTPFPVRRKKEVNLCESISQKCEQQLQVLFAVDQSGSIRPDNFKLAKDTIAEFIDYMPDNQSLFGVLFYNEEPSVCIDYEQLKDKKTTIEKVRKWKYAEGGTKTGLAIQKSLSLVEPKRKTLNPHVYVLTDGKSQDDVVQISKVARDRKLILNAVGIGKDVSVAELEQIAFDKNHVSQFGDFKKMQCNVKQLIANVCFQPDLKAPDQSFKVDCTEQGNVIFGIKVEKSSNVRVVVKNAGRDETVIYGAVNIENPDELVSDYFHSGNSGDKSIVFKFVKNDGDGSPEKREMVRNGIQLKTGEQDLIAIFLEQLSDQITIVYRDADDRLIFGKNKNTPDVDKDFYYAFVNIHSNKSRELEIQIQKCKDGEEDCRPGTNDESRDISNYWFLVVIVLLLLVGFFFLCKLKSKLRTTGLTEQEYSHI